MKSLSALTVAGALFCIFAIVLSVIFYVYFVKRTGGESPFNDVLDRPDDTIIFDAAPQKVTESQLVDYLYQNGAVKLRETGAIFHRNGRRFNIDPAFAVAVAKVETALGMGNCDDRMSIVTWNGCNNFFCLEYDSRVFMDEGDGQCSGTKWASFGSVERGITAFFEYIDIRYLRSSPSQDSVSKVGCQSDSFSRCYCDSSGKGCGSWADSVTRSMNEVRAFGAND